MTRIRYPEERLRALLARAISIRWPRERALLMTECTAEEATVEPGIVGRAPLHFERVTRRLHGLAAATQHRLVFEDGAVPTRLARRFAATLGGFAVFAMIGERASGWFLGLAVTALALWAGAKLLEPTVFGRRYVEFAKVHAIDRVAQAFEGIGPGGRIYKLLIPDPSDFRLLVAIANGQAGSGAA